MARSLRQQWRSLAARVQPLRVLLAAAVYCGVGAAWYGVLSVLWCAMFPAQPVQAMLVRLFAVLGDYVQFKASLFEASHDIDIQHKRLALAQLNASVVTELNNAKEGIFCRIRVRAPTGRIARYRGLHQIAQDVHERASSSHANYNALAYAVFHILPPPLTATCFVAASGLGLQGHAGKQLAQSIARRETFVSDGDSVQALAELRHALEHARAERQSMIAVAAGVLFFARRIVRYLVAIAAITLLVLMCFDQVGDSEVLIVPRLLDTAIGSIIAGLAVLFVLPHWQGRRIHELAVLAMRHHAGYLRQIVEQYRSSARDDLDYRLARCNAHNPDAALSMAISEMFRESNFVRSRAGAAPRWHLNG